MVEAAYIKLKDHRWYLSKRLAPRTCLAPHYQIAMKRKWQMQSSNISTKLVLIATNRLKQKILGQNVSNILLS